MSKYSEFIFKDYQFEPSTKTLKLFYGFDDQLDFCESYHFDFDFADYDEEILSRAVESLFFIAGVSYYKAYPVDMLVIKKGQLSHDMAKFYSKTYQRGLGEFYFLNKLDPNQQLTFPSVEDTTFNSDKFNHEGLLIGLGGGKDSLVSIELLRNSGIDLATWSLGHRSQLEPLVSVIGLPHYWVERSIDQSLLELNLKDALNGHVPISAILACVGIIVSVLTGRRDVVVSNENSANEPDLEYMGQQINHQYSKSLEFEKDFQEYLHFIRLDNRYYSYLRPFSELFIAEIFSKVGFQKYRSVFSSCNRAFTHQSDHMFWCGECPKCAFTFLALTPFISKDELESIWGKNLLLDNSLDKTYKQLLGIDGDKPLDCVGEIKESRAAMRIAQTIYPELDKYEFELPDTYDYRNISAHAMPQEIYNQLMLSVDSLI